MCFRCYPRRYLIMLIPIYSGPIHILNLTWTMPLRRISLISVCPLVESFSWFGICFCTNHIVLTSILTWSCRQTTNTQMINRLQRGSGLRAAEVLVHLSINIWISLLSSCSPTPNHKPSSHRARPDAIRRPCQTALDPTSTVGSWCSMLVRSCPASDLIHS
jgi:hypothetical protein